MKKLVTVIALALICSGAYAQFNKGRYLVGGNVGFAAYTGKTKTDNSTSTTSHSTTFNLSPDVGYFVIDNLAVGAGLSLRTSSTKGDGGDNSKDTDTDFTLTPFARYYLDQGIFFQGQVGFGSGSNKHKPNGSNTTTTTKHGVFDWGLGVGYAYFLNDYVAIEPMVSYVSYANNYKDPDFKTVNSGITLNVGFQIYLGPRN